MRNHESGTRPLEATNRPARQGRRSEGSPTVSRAQKTRVRPGEHRRVRLGPARKEKARDLLHQRHRVPDLSEIVGDEETLIPGDVDLGPERKDHTRGAQPVQPDPGRGPSDALPVARPVPPLARAPQRCPRRG